MDSIGGTQKFFEGGETFVLGDWRTMDTMLKIMREYAMLTFFGVDVGGGLNCSKVHSNDLSFWTLVRQHQVSTL